MNPLKSLLKQTAIYGMSTIVLRMMTWGLTFYFSYHIDKREMGINADLLALAAFLNIIYMFGMETSYFRFVKDHDENKVFAASQTIVFFNSLFWSLVLCVFATPIVEVLSYPDKEEYIYLLAAVLFFENTSNIPFASMRYKEQAMKFMRLKAYNVILNVALTIFLLSCIHSYRYQLPIIGSDDPNILILSAILIPWVLTFIYFSKSIFRNLKLSDAYLYREMIQYSYPLLIVGLAGMVNEVADRQFLKYLLPYGLDKNLEHLALYNVNYKLSIVMTLAIQAFRMGAEPFFFREAKNQDSTKTYAMVMDFFIIICTVIMVVSNLLRDILSSFAEKSYKEGVDILPILLLANLFLGVYYNTTIWFKLTNNTNKGAIITLIGAVVSISSNLILIPILGYKGAAWAHLACYLVMTFVSVIWGQRIYPIPYHFLYNALWICVGVIYSQIVFHFYRGNNMMLICSSILFVLLSSIFTYKRLLFIRKTTD